MARGATSPTVPTVPSSNGKLLGLVSLPPSIARVVNAIRRIGHSTEEAVMDIVDNSVAKHATQISVFFSGTTRVERIEIADNGMGMTFDGLKDAMRLGSAGDYGADALANLSKYGLGLKSAALSQGQRLTVMTRAEGGDLLKAVLDAEIILKKNEYLIDFSEPSPEEQAFFEERTQNKNGGEQSGGVGTVVIIDKIDQGTALGLTAATNRVRKALGETYHRFMTKPDPISFFVNGKGIAPSDPLFLGDSEVTTLLNPQKMEIEDTGGHKATITIRATQLPHPPTYSNRKEIKEKYGIKQPNTGLYVYRCNRIIKRAVTLDIFTTDTKNLAFRGSVDLGPDADELISLDVAKRRVVLPDHVRSQLERAFTPALHMSTQMWRTAADKVTRSKTGGESPSIHRQSSSQINAKDGLMATGRKERTTPRQKAEQASKTAKKLPRITQPPKDKVRIIEVPDLPDGLLWQPGYDENGQVYVQVNRSHPFYVKVYRPGEDADDRDNREHNREQREFVEAVDYLLWGLSHAEFNIGYDDQDKIEMMERIRRFTSSNLRTLLSE